MDDAGSETTESRVLIGASCITFDELRYPMLTAFEEAFLKRISKLVVPIIGLPFGTVVKSQLSEVQAGGNTCARLIIACM